MGWLVVLVWVLELSSFQRNNIIFVEYLEKRRKEEKESRMAEEDPVESRQIEDSR